MSKKLIITADDFGLVNHIDEAVIDMVEKRIVSCVSSFANINADRLKLQTNKLIEKNPAIGVGVHLSITSHEPLIATNLAFVEIVNQKVVFKNLKKLIFRELIANKEDLKAELQAQIDNLREILAPRLIDHISCHHNLFYLDETLFEIYLELAIDNNIPIRSPQRCGLLKHFKVIKHFEPLIPDIALEGIHSLPKRYLLNAFKANSKKQVSQYLEKMTSKSVKSPSYFLINLYGNPDLNILRAAYPLINEANDEICEQIMHLSIGATKTEIASTPNGINHKYFDGRKLEYELLQNQEFIELLSQHQRNGLELGSFQHHFPNEISPISA